MASKDKFSFSIDGIKYTDIKSIGSSGNNKIYIGVAGTAQMIRQWMKQKYSQFPLRDYYFISSRSFANGNAIDVYLNDAPENIYKEINRELEDKFEYGSYHTGSKQGGQGIKSKTDEGDSIDYGTKYLSVNNRQPYGSNAPSVDWNISLNTTVVKSKRQIQSKYAKNTFDKGDLLVDCAGWEVFKKKYADGRILYTCQKKPNTPLNKVDWSTIKGEIYTQTGFSYSRFGNFQKYGLIADEAYVINLLCKILEKYYTEPSLVSTNMPTISVPQKSIGLNESYKLVPPNPQLEYCEIKQAEGSYDDGVLPIRFSSWTALTKFIADNIINFPKEGEGYDKYYILYKWRYLDFEEGDRWDIGESESDPYKYSNLWAYLRLRSMCFYAWQKNGISLASLTEDDKESILPEKIGWEINSVQFLSILGDIINLFEQNNQRFDYNTFKERFDRFSEVYPLLFQLLSTDVKLQQSNDDIQKIIKGLEVLSKMGNKDADQKIKVYKIMLKSNIT